MKFVKILYVWEHDVSLGDSLTNFYSHLSILKEKHRDSIIYVIIHPRTYNTDVSNILLERGLIDFVFPIHINKVNDVIYDHYMSLLQNIKFDIILHNQHSQKSSCELINDIYPDALILQTMESDFGYLPLFEYCDLNHVEFLEKLRKVYHTDYTLDFVRRATSHASFQKKVCIFSGSTRPLASISSEGINKIVEATSDLGYHNFLIGTSTFNIYTDSGVNWNVIYGHEYKNTTNLIGNNWNKTLKFINESDVVISGPTGAAMISPLINKKQILIVGGDSPIMEGCINGYTNGIDTLKCKCKCVNYPCDPHNTKIDIEKYNGCLERNNAMCLNEELNIDELGRLLI
jgi:hypothetical protein